MKRIRIAAAVLATLIIAQSTYGFFASCICILEIEANAFIPREGFHSLSAGNGTILINDVPIAALSTFDIEFNLQIDPDSPDTSIASVTSISGFVPGVAGIGASTWSLGEATPNCANQLQFDFSQTSPEADNVIGCFTLNVRGAFGQDGVEVVVDGTNFDPAGIRPLETIGRSDNFLFDGPIFNDGFESGDTTAWPATIP